MDEYEALEGTAEILSDEDTLAAIRHALDDLVAGDVVPLEEVHDEHATRKRRRLVAKVVLARSAHGVLAELDFPPG